MPGIPTTRIVAGRGVLASAVIFAGLLAASGDVSSASGEAQDTSLNITKVGRVELPGAMSVGFSSREAFAYVNTLETHHGPGAVTVFNVSDPRHPKWVSEIQVPTGNYMEDMDVAERSDGTTFVLVRGAGNGLQVVDVSNPHKPRLRGHVPNDVHTWTCVTRECYFAYGALDLEKSADGTQRFPVVDLTNLDRPKIEYAATNYGIHDWGRDAAGVMWSHGIEGIAAYDASTPSRPIRLNTSDHNGVVGSLYNGAEMHSSLRPNASRFQPHLGKGTAHVDKGNVLVAVDEGANLHTDCSDKVSTWYIPYLDEAAYLDHNPNQLIGLGSIEPLDSWSLRDDTIPGETRPLSGAEYHCSLHWFDYHQAGFLIVPGYAYGIHLLDVRDPHRIRQVGFHFAPGSVEEQAYWVPERDRSGRTTGRATTMVYTADAGSINDYLTRALSGGITRGGIDIFEVTLPE